MISTAASGQTNSYQFLTNCGRVLRLNPSASQGDQRAEAGSIGQAAANQPTGARYGKAE
jgi:hypothetical protein